MITKYSIDLRQFNNGESDKITFPSFDQCLMYGIHKLKKALEKGNAIIQAILIEDSHGRKIVVTLSEDELDYTETLELPSVKVKLRKDLEDGDVKFIF